ncbi:MAG: class II aldolase/adducin family protein [Rhizobiales bacterium]|nr:class II aldolase/adducin family protein [Hyphomicrobiales bacterium]
MSDLDDAVNDIVLANRILAHEGVVDAFGHVSMRHPHDPNKYLLSRARSPELVEHGDILEFSLTSDIVGERSGRPYLERFIHGAIYEANPEIMAVVHSHADEVLPYGISSVPMRSVIHTASECGGHIPVWDIRDKFGDTTLLVANQDQGRDLARCLGKHRVALMRGHGFAAAGRTLNEVLKTSVYLPRNAKVLTTAIMLGGDIIPLSDGEIAARDFLGPGGADQTRMIEYWARRAGCGGLLREKKR